MGNWKTCELGDLLTFQRGHDLPKSQVIEGKYPIAGSNGIIGYHNEFTTKAPSITIGRSGNIGNPFLYETDFWAHNTTLYIKEFTYTFIKKEIKFYNYIINNGKARPIVKKINIIYK